MSLRSREILLCTSLAFLSIASTAKAQTLSRSQVSGTGVVNLSKHADTMRVNVDVIVAGKDLKDALAQLKDRKEVAKTTLLSLGATEKTIQFGEAELKSSQSESQRQMERMVQMRMKARGKKGKETKPKPQPVSLGCRLTAEWPLAGKTPEELMIASDALQEKIKAADLGGLKELEKKNAMDKEETSEEMEEMQMGMQTSENGETKPGEPTFIYVRRITEAENEKAMADAFQKAKVNAAKLAKAAGAGVGALNNVSSSVSQVNPYDYRSSRQYYQWQQNMQSESEEENAEPQLEATGPQPGKVSYRVTITATFELK